MPPASARPDNEALRAVIAESGLSYRALAGRVRLVAAENGENVNTNSAAISHWVQGTPPRPATATYLTEALSRAVGRIVSATEIGVASASDAPPNTLALAGDPVAALAEIGRSDVDRREFLTSAVYSVSALALPLAPEAATDAAQRGTRSRAGGTVGAREVDAVRDITDAFTRSDERLGGAVSRSAVVEYLVSDVAAYCKGRFADDQARRSMFGAAAELAYLAGWKAHDAGRRGLAQRYYLHAYQLADESASPHAAYVLRILAHQAMDTGVSEHCVDLADAALARVKGRTSPETEMLFHLTAARAHAAERNTRPALRALATAEKLIDQAGQDESPRWASLGGPAEARLTNQGGKALTALGDLIGAEEQYRRSAACWNPATHPRIHALTLADLGEAQVRRGHLGEACDTWSTALDSMAGVRSARARDAVADIRAHIRTYRGRGVPEAARLDARAARWQRDHTAAQS
ncbi:tetratricopeptide repeat protein [Nocardiopsis mangrovi]|uniref:Tetratricopeptide repeat protein n=1 Tax=Nocardiopsis mangrovi TaxID=1179818 RepID=A0ABV9E233_9ACTN